MCKSSLIDMSEKVPSGTKCGNKSDRVWLFDSGATHVCRPNDESSDLPVKTTKVDLAGDKSTGAGFAKSGEVVMAGEPLIGMGRAIRLGKWSFTWLKDCGPSLVELTVDQQQEIQEIINRGVNTLTPKVSGDLPYFSESQARVIRDAISPSNHPGVKIRRTEVSDRLQKSLEGAEALPFIGVQSVEFVKWLKQDASRRMLIKEVMSSSQVGRDDCNKAWSNRKSDIEFQRWLDQQVLVESDDEEVVQVNSPEDLEEPHKCVVSFGPDKTHHFFSDEEEENLKLDEARPLMQFVAMQVHNKKSTRQKEVTLDEYQQHCLTHANAFAGCEVCEATRKRHVGFTRGGATGADDPKIAGRELIVMDWACPSGVASDGSRFMAVVGHVGLGCIFVRGYKGKTGSSVDALHEARKLWGIEKRPFVLHTDNEKNLIGTDMIAYLKEQGKCSGAEGEPMFGIPHRSNTDSRAEAAVKKGVEGVRALVYQSGIPTKWWPLAADAFTIESARRVGIEPKFNTTSPVPFGTLGRALIPSGITMKDKFDTKVNFVSYMGIERHTSGGVRVLYCDATNKVRKATVLARDIEWSPGEYGLVRTRDNLNEVVKLFPKCLPVNPVSRHQASCDKCSKWRFVPDEMAEGLEGRSFHCTDVKLKCQDPEDDRVYRQFDDDEFPSGKDELEFPDEELAQAMRQKAAAEEVAKVRCSRASLTGGCESDGDELDDTGAALLKLACCRIDEGHIAEILASAAKEEKEEHDATGCPVIVKTLVVPNKEALSDECKEKPEWLEAVDSEIKSLWENGVLRLIDPKDLKPGDEVLPSLLILTLKSTGRRKARIVACGNFQKMPSQDAYCGVIGHDGWLQNFVMAVKLGLTVAQIDISTAFLQTDSRDDDPNRPRTVLRPPKDCPKPKGQENCLWEVVKSIYGLRSAPASWKSTLVRWLATEGYEPCAYDENVYVNKKDGNLVLLYVDDLVFIGEDPQVKAILKKLKQRFDTTPEKTLQEATKDKPLEFLAHDLWIEGDVLHVSQHRYAETLVKRFGMNECKAVRSLDSKEFERSTLSEGGALDSTKQSTLRSIVGGVQYLAQGTRPELCAPIPLVSEGQSSGTDRHVDAGKKVIRYVKGSTGRHLQIRVDRIRRGGRVTIRADFDASFGTSYGRSGLCLYVDGGLTYWQSKRQRCITLSTAEAELVSATNAGRELIGARNFLEAIWGSTSKYKLSFELEMRGDSQAANLIAGRQANITGR